MPTQRGAEASSVMNSCLASLIAFSCVKRVADEIGANAEPKWARGWKGSKSQIHMDLARYRLGGGNMERREDLQFYVILIISAWWKKVCTTCLIAAIFPDFDPNSFPKFRDSDE